MEITGRLEGWYYDGLNHVIWGNIYDDMKDRWWEGAFIHTSNLAMQLNPELTEGMVVKTRNSRYLLGKPLTNAEK